MHYFLTDSRFNYCTDVAFNTIIEQLEYGKTVILMSATGNEMMDYINQMGLDYIDYTVEPSYDFINSLTFWNKDATLDRYLDELIKSGERAIFFIQKATKGYSLYKKYKDNILFNCGKSDQHHKHVEKGLIKEMLATRKLPKQILITTTCMDAGVSIEDSDITKIFVEVDDVNTMIQCIGRKRNNNGEKLDIYIHNINNQMFGGKIKTANDMLAPAEYLLHKSEDEYNLEYGRSSEKNDIVYEDVNGKKHINQLMYFKCHLDLNLYHNLIKVKYGYCKCISEIFRQYCWS